MMLVTDEQLENIRGRVASWMVACDGSHDMAHVERVVATVKEIYSKEKEEMAVNADLNLLLAIAYLHDTFDRKYCEDTEARAREIVGELTTGPEALSEPTAKFIIDRIHNMSYSAELKNGISEEVAVDPYIAIVQDADRLDAIGAIGICRCMVYSGANGRPIVSEGGEEEMKLRQKFEENPDSTKPSAVEYAKKSRSAVAHFYEKLLQLKESMKTRTGGEMAEERHQFMLQFLDQLFDEVKGVK